MLKIAIQKSGRLYDHSLQLLKECGIEINNGNRQLKTVAFNFPIEVFFLRDDDIPQYVFDNVADIGFVGENVVQEANREIDVITRLGFGRCRLSIAVPKNMNYKNITDLENLKIATSYSRLLKKYLEDKKQEESKDYKLELAGDGNDQTELGISGPVGNRPGRILECKLLRGDTPTRFWMLAVANDGDHVYVIRCECNWENRQIWREEFLELLRSVKFKN